jgi:hypothetical protein
MKTNVERLQVKGFKLQGNAAIFALGFQLLAFSLNVQRPSH